MHIRNTFTAGMLCAALSASAALAETTLNYSSWLPENHWLNTLAMKPWMAQVADVTGGEVIINQLPKPVGVPADQFDVCRDGLADICVVVVGYTPGRFPLAEAGELPFLGDDVTVAAPGFDAFYRENFLQYDEMAGIFPLTVFKIAPGHVFTKSVPVKSVADFKGLKLRTPGKYGTLALEAVGAVPILKSSTEAYELLAQGVIDGSLMLEESVASTNATDLMHYATLVPGGMFSAVLAVVMNQRAWNSLSEEQRAQIASVSGPELAALFGQGYQEVTIIGREAYTAAGYEITTVEGEFLDELQSALAPLDDAWIEAAKAKGVENGRELLDELRAALQD